MRKTYDDPEFFVDSVKTGIDMERRTRTMHPTDEAEALREIQKHVDRLASEREGANAESGVPERPEDQKEISISERMDGGRS